MGSDRGSGEEAVSVAVCDVTRYCLRTRSASLALTWSSCSVFLAGYGALDPAYKIELWEELQDKGGKKFGE